ncbi:NshR/TsnR family 23S rRNA methyltransferase [Nocardia sp. NPDC051570]|uniref:NshR/TsnR family 23S rRNA methyltransferase n=1 Tax=Nocardia sp. NPDC051570 TaxID=3364324 RepID=UPI003792662E
MTAMPTITDKSDPAVQRILDITKPSRGNIKTTLIEDIEPISHCLRAGLDFVEIYATEKNPLPDDIVAVAESRGIPIRTMDSAIVNHVFKVEKKPKVFGIARVPRPCGFADTEKKPGDLVVLDGVKIVGNIGAIIRTSYALGVSGIVLVDSDLTSIADRRLIRASRGYVFSLPIVLADRAAATKYLSDNGVPMVVFDAGGAITLGELERRDERLALLFGSEKTGPSSDFQGVRKISVSIPMSEAAESLNVSVAAGIALYQRSGRGLEATR